MALLPIKPLDGAGGYLRWKESLLLRVRSLDVAYVLSEARPAGAGREAAVKKWARDDAVCRGHILCTLSDRLLPDYARFTTAAELWRALARTYDMESSYIRFYQFRFDRSTGDVLLEQLAHAEALGAAAGLRDEDMAPSLRRMMPMGMIPPHSPGSHGEKELDHIWRIARNVASSGLDPWYEEKKYMKKLDADDREQTTTSRKRGRR